MSLTYTQMQQLLTEVKPCIEGTICAAVKVVSANTFVFAWQPAGAQPCTFLLLCLQAPFLRFHLTGNPLASMAPTPFSKGLEKGVVGQKVSACVLLNEDRILALQFSSGSKVIIELLPRRPNCYLVDGASQILAAWHPTNKTVYQLPNNPKNSVGRQLDEAFANSRAIEAAYLQRERESSFIKQKQALSSRLQTLVLRADKTVQQRSAALAQCRQWQQWQHKGVLLQSQLFRLCKGMKEVAVEDWQEEGKSLIIELDPLVEPYLQVAALFKRSKKLRLGEPHALRLLQQAEHTRVKQQQLLARLEKIATAEALQTFCQELQFVAMGRASSVLSKPVVPKKVLAKPYHIYCLADGLQAWVGKSAKDNDKLTFQCANGSDWWLHIRDYPGSHVVVRCHKGKVLEGEALNDAAELALRFSKAQGIKAAEVALSQVKFLKRVKGIPGKVQLSKHKVVHHVLDDVRWQRLKNSKNVVV